MKKGRVLLVLSATMVTLLGSVLQVSAAAPSYAGIFDAEYYAETYSDVAAVYGDDEQALYNHYLTYGIYEGRNASQAFDVQSYRESYGDLQAAFGDDWKAYADHYLTYGLSEGRDGGGMFDAVSYANRYSDLKEAFGYDITKLWSHYEQFGVNEGRNAISQNILDQWAAESPKADNDSYIKTYVDEYGYTIVEEVKDGVLRSLYGYDPDGKLGVIYLYNSQGKVTSWTNYNPDGDLVYEELYFYNADGLLSNQYMASYVEDFSFDKSFQYDEYNRLILETVVYKEDSGYTFLYYVDYIYEGNSNVLIKTEERYE